MQCLLSRGWRDLQHCLLYVSPTPFHTSQLWVYHLISLGIFVNNAKIFPPNIEFNRLPFCHTFGAIYFTLYQGWKCQHWRVHQAGHKLVQQIDYKLSSWKGIAFIYALTKLAQSEYQRRKKVSCWILRSVLHTLSLDPLPSISIIVDCLSIIAICLNCDISDVRSMTLNERQPIPARYLPL